MKHCTCGAKAEVHRSTRRALDGHEEIIYRVICPVCGQLGPAVPLSDKEEGVVITEAIQAWNDMIAELRPMGN